MIKLGYEVGTAKEINIPESHLIVTGLTQMAGKTTTLESLIKRSKKKAIVFRTKVGEKSFLSGAIIPPYFKDRSDWQFIQGLVEATIKERLRSFERAKIIQICKMTSGNSLFEFKKKVDERLGETKINNFEKDILTNLQAYLEIVLPKLQSITFSSTLDLNEGLNIIDLERFSRDPEVQSLIIRSVLEEVLYKFKNTIIVIPEAWKFIPQSRGNPCKLMVEEFIRQGATNKNFLWIDSQDMTGVDKTPLKQISEWILGYQSEKNEVKHTLDQLPIPKSSKPKEDDIMSLGTGVFYYASRDITTKVYVQPFWLDDEKSKQIALGELKVSEIDVPQDIKQYKISIKKDENQQLDTQETEKRFNKELTEMRTDFFNKIEDIQEQLNKAFTGIYDIKNSNKEIDIDLIIGKVLQKIPTNNNPTSPTIDIDSIVQKVMSKVQTGQIVYEVSPIEKIKKDFIQTAKEKILQDVSTISEDAKKLLKYLESRTIAVTINELCVKCFLMKQSGGNYGQVVNNAGKELIENNLGEKQTNGRFKGLLKKRITELLQIHESTDIEINNLYDHIIMEILK